MGVGGKASNRGGVRGGKKLLHLRAGWRERGSSKRCI